MSFWIAALASVLIMWGGGRVIWHGDSLAQVFSGLVIAGLGVLIFAAGSYA
jgi:hypothetical protein